MSQNSPAPAAPLAAAGPAVAHGLLNPERLAEITELTGILLKMENFGMAWPFRPGTATRAVADALCDLRSHAAALSTQLAAAKQEGASLQLLALDSEVARLNAEVANNEMVKTGGLLLARAEKAEAENVTLAARLAEEQQATEQLKEQHKVEVLDILRDLRLPPVPVPEPYTHGGLVNYAHDFAKGQNQERQAINDYCRQKAYEYSREGIGPDPTREGEWDTLRHPLPAPVRLAAQPDASQSPGMPAVVALPACPNGDSACQHCANARRDAAKAARVSASELLSITAGRLIVCPTCGNKRCPKANFHGNACTNSNEVGQPGSAWEHCPRPSAAPAPHQEGGVAGE